MPLTFEVLGPSPAMQKIEYQNSLEF